MTTTTVVCYDEWPGDPLDGELAGYDGPGWYFWDETQAYCHGPFGTKEDAESALTSYCESL